jgi:hypothetical protein
MKKMNSATHYLAVLALAFLLTHAQDSAQVPAATTPALSASETVPPDQQATGEQLDKLFEVMRLRQQLQATMKAIPAMIQQQLHAQMDEMYAKLPGGGKPTPDQQAKLEEIMNKYIQRAATLYSPDDMMGDITAVYQRHMSKSDVDAYIAFYSSPAGQHLLDAQPKIMQEYMPVVMGRVQKASANLTNDMTKELGDYIKSSGATSPAAK